MKYLKKRQSLNVANYLLFDVLDILGLPQKQNVRRAYKIRLCGHFRRYKKIVKKTYINHILIFINYILTFIKYIGTIVLSLSLLNFVGNFLCAHILSNRIF